MDLITKTLFEIKNPLITIIGEILHNNYIYLAVLAIIIYHFEKNNEKRAKIAFAILITLIVCISIKNLTERARPCIELIWCPNDYSFPSIHSATAFALMMGFIRKDQFPIMVLFALFVSFTRINIGVHTIEDVAGALPIAVLCYYFTYNIWSRVLVWIENFKGRFST